MEAILFDCRDVGRGCTLRVFDRSNMIIQAWLHGADPVGLGQRLSELLGIQMEYRGSPVGCKMQPLMTSDGPEVYDVPAKPPAVEVIHAKDRNQLVLF